MFVCGVVAKGLWVWVSLCMLVVKVVLCGGFDWMAVEVIRVVCRGRVL